MLNVMAGHDARDACSVDLPVPDYTAGLTGSLQGVRIGVDRLSGACASADPALEGLIDDAIAELEAAGAIVTDVTIPYYHELTSTTMLGMAAEAYAYHAPDMQSRWFDWGQRVPGGPRHRRAVLGCGLHPDAAGASRGPERPLPSSLRRGRT